jgi:hypothetical protein
MISIQNRIVYFAIIFISSLSLSCKDDNILNAYLNLTEQSRIDETINLNSDSKSLNITVYDSKSNELVSDANVNLKLPSGIILSKKTNGSGSVKFILEKSVTGTIEINAESSDSFYKDKINFEISETFNYSLSIYIE